MYLLSLLSFFPLFCSLYAAEHALEKIKYKIQFPKNPVTAPAKFPDDIILVPTSGKHTPPKLRPGTKEPKGFIVTSIYSGFGECSGTPSIVIGTENNVCFTAIDSKTFSPVGSVVYHYRRVKILTTEFSTFDCSGDPMSTMATLYPLGLCFHTPLQNTSISAAFVESATPWTNFPPGVNFLYPVENSQCEKPSSTPPAHFEWIPYNRCFSATIGTNTQGGISFNSCAHTVYQFTTFHDQSCTTQAQQHESKHTVCVKDTYGPNFHSSHALTCNK